MSAKNCGTRAVSSTVGKPSIGLAAYKERIKSKPVGSARTVIGPSTLLSIDLATRLSGAAFGFEGERIFPTLFQSNLKKWIPPVEVTEKIKAAVKEELKVGSGES